MSEVEKPKQFLGRTIAPLIAAGSLLSACARETSHDVHAVKSQKIEQAGYAGLVALIGDVEQYRTPIITDWEACPKGDSTLPEGTNVNAFSLPIISASSAATFIEIGSELTIVPSEKIQEGFIGDQDGEDETILPPEQVEVYEHNGDVMAWCGPSIGVYVDLGILGPEQGTIVVIPNIESIDPYRYRVG